MDASDYSSTTLDDTRTADNPARELDGYHILVVEDDPMNLRLVQMILEKAGAKVSSVNDGAQASRLFDATSMKQVRFDAILMDIFMPVMDGYDATRAIRKAGYDQPIIALTANTQKNDRQSCLDVGCNEYLTKPINRSLLISTLVALTSNA